MTPVSNTRRWRRIEDLFYAALDLEPSARQAFLDDACANDPELRDELNSLLKSSEQTLGFARRAVQEVAQHETDGDTLADRYIGAYRLLRVLGKGGMGTVYLATRADDLYQQNVAIKLMHASIATARSMRLRFSAERQILANLNHPNIGRLLDGGVTADGLPYLVMEYVNGIPIDAYCREHRLSTRNLIQLFLKVCAAVEYAHQNLVIHRDIKPGNILVTPEGIPKLLDFGIAKLLDGAIGPGDRTASTERVMTPEYASPEQLSGKAITTATDVYVLGALLYELLCGVHPFQAKRKRPLELLAMICEQQPERPSKARRAEEQGAYPADYRRFRDDLDDIVMMAMRKEPERRYESVALFATDLRRCLECYPVRAHADTWVYSAGKFIRRHKTGVIAATIVAVALIGFAIAQSVELRNTRRERDRADRITQFMTGMFKVPDPNEARGNTVTAREILDKASKEIDTGLRNDPELQAKMMYTMAVTYGGLGLDSRAQPLLERAVEIQQRVLGRGNPDTLRSMNDLARVLSNEGHYAEAEKLQRQTLDIQRQVLGPRNPDTLRSMSDLARVLSNEGRYAEAEKPQRQILDIQRRVLGPENLDTLSSASNLAVTLRDEGRYSDAENLFRETLDKERRILGPEDPTTLTSMDYLAGTLTDEERYAEAEKLVRETLDIERRVLGPEHPNTLITMVSLAYTLMREGRYAEAEKLVRVALDIQRRVLGPEHPDTLGNIELEAIDISYQGRYGEAEKLFREAIQTAGKANQPDVLGRAWYSFACGAAIAGRRREALEYLGRAIDHGSVAPDWMATDPDLKSLHGDPRFDALVAKANQLPGAKTH